MASQNLIGQNIGKYRILQALGRGGMAQVYKAYHPKLDRYVAIKILRSDLVEQDDFLERFKHEARAVSSLRHPNIVQVFDFDIEDDQYYMVMELLEGDSLRARLNAQRIKNERLPLPEALKIVNDVLIGLAHAHQMGVIHRDIKPANIMLTTHGQAVLTDFGIAQIVGSTQHTVTGALMGTLHYMAPEQGLKNACDARSDLYSLGIVLYEMLNGAPPFDGETPLAILLKHLNEPLPPLRQSLPPEVQAIVLKALAKDPAARYQNAKEMAAAIQQILRTEAFAPLTETPPARTVFSGDARYQLDNLALLEADTTADKIHPQKRPPLTGVYHSLERFAPHITSPISAVFINLALFTAVNLLAAIINKIANINLLTIGWPFELFLISSLLSFIGWGLQTPWMLLPAIIIFSNAIALTYTALTGRWDEWDFLWVWEPLIIGVAIYLPTKLHERPRSEIPVWGRFSGFAMGILSIALACIVSLLAAWNSLWQGF